MKTYVMTPHLNHLVEMVLMRNKKNYPSVINKYSFLSKALI